MLTPRIARALQYAMAGEEYSNGLISQLIIPNDNLLQFTTGHFTVNSSGVVTPGSQIGAGWSVVAGTTPGSYVVTLSNPSTQVVTASASAGTQKTQSAADDAFYGKVASWSNTNATTSVVTICTYLTSSGAVTAEACTIQFQVVSYTPVPQPPSLP